MSRLISSGYVLNAGVWFKVAASYLESVKTYLENIPDVTDERALSAWPKRESSDGYVDEGDYNKSLAKERNYALLDAQNLHFGAQQKVEICDLLTSDRQMLCVKRASRSSALSHLFAQGNVSSSLMHEPKYRARVLEAMTSINGPSEWGSPDGWTIVFAIGTTKEGPLASSLFFFSQVNLMMAARDIRSRNIKVAIARIPQ